MRKKTIKIPREGVLRLFDNKNGTAVLESGDINLPYSHMVYVRESENGQTGVIQTVTGVDIEVNREWYEKADRGFSRF